jgi:hypothetical protein
MRGKLSVACEALGAGGLADQDRCAERAAAGLGEQLGMVQADEVAQLALERLGFAGQHADAFDLFARDAHPLALCGSVRRRRVMRCSCPG